MQSSSPSSWSFGQGNNLQAQLTVNTCEETHRVNSKYLAFQCNRFASTRDQMIEKIFKNAINGQSHLDMLQDRACGKNAVMKHCGNRRRYLSECRCETLNRVAQPQIRYNYENQVIKTIFNILNKRDSSLDRFHFKLAIFCSGYLLGEQVLLFRLLDALKNKNAKGIVEVFLIDRCYKDPIANFCSNDDVLTALGSEYFMHQFFEEMCYSLPQNITLKGSFFDSSDNYIALAEKYNELRHDLLIGADIESVDDIMGEIGEKAGRDNSLFPPIALIKCEVRPGDEEPRLCLVDSMGILEESCYNPSNIHIPKENHISEYKKDKDETSDTIILIAAAAFIAISGLFIFFNSPSKRRN